MREKLTKNHLVNNSSYFVLNFWFIKQFNESKKSDKKNLFNLLFVFFLFFIVFPSNILAYKKGFYQGK